MSNQQFQLKIGICHHPTLKTTQLLEFLQNQTNQFLTNELPQNMLISESFLSTFEQIPYQSPIDYNEYVGLIILYSSSSLESYQYAKANIPEPEQLDNLFLLFVEMDNTEKKMNVVAGEGEELCRRLGLMFIRLSMYNSEDLVANLNRSIFYLVQNYYYPNEQQKNPKTSLENQVTPNEYILNYDDSHHKIIASKQQKSSIINNIEKASRIRQSRQKQILLEQNAIDESIQNLESVLNNINHHIKEKMDSGWFMTLKDSLYRPIQKKSNIFNKIKLTQQFVDDQSDLAYKSIRKSRVNQKDKDKDIYHSKYNTTLQMQLKKLESTLLKVVIVLEEKNIAAQVQIYENSNFDQLAVVALKKLGLNHENENNILTMRDKIRGKTELYIKQLSKHVNKTEKQRLFQKSSIDSHKK